ncbi:MAG TPA: YihY/virulence factor BrkB family protein [Candidatus Limnocylindria bacterium]|nr:YihY/virulence factor BrkB family protein [Candidatus Limnocylindria bacterium]
MKRLLAFLLKVFRDAFASANGGGIFVQSAALSYYTVFAIAPLFIIVLAIAGLWFGQEAAQKQLFGQLSEMVGTEGGEAIQAVVAAARHHQAGIWATLVAVGTLFAASTAVFVQLQDSLNLIWRVEPPAHRGLKDLVRHRIVSFAMILGIGFLLLVSLIISSFLATMTQLFGTLVSNKDAVLSALNFFVSLGIITLLFTLILKVLPDVKMGWKPPFLGGFLTAILFNVGKFLFSIYIGHSSIVSVYGAMGSLVVILLWVYYSAQILLFGAHFTKVLTKRTEGTPLPTRDATPIKGAQDATIRAA